VPTKERCAEPEHVRRQYTYTDPSTGETKLWWWCWTCKLNNKADRRADARRAVLEHYGNACACCGLAVPALLTIDHVLAVGGARSGRRGGDALYRRLIREGSPPGYQVLCYSCNDGKHGHRAVCPHQQEPPELASRGGHSHRRVKVETMGAYGDGRYFCLWRGQRPPTDA